MSIIALTRKVIDTHQGVDILGAAWAIRMTSIIVQGFSSVARGFRLATTLFVKALVGLGGVWLEVAERGGTATCIVT
jgi:hypothetical protein